ncbi:SPI-2 type III secretion system translocon protein SseC [Salmonella enterica subsp. enterica serovar Napoli]|uniref:SPI-2 type III secretion system translocon protein SseC n=1 Tax=Salmonella enterica subsp. enterica serovar Napoli TaxID=1151001 RepID=A0A5H6KK57_SALET|nr:SPI-2 type III secretion system translocon protein SseC [Salmonella enterica]EAC0524413.1 SPI-2 type III secretion system translocon protein SseC [Salmonella enterica subsp. enterica serovar Zaiman]EBN0188820.1 SPI-2 type III secretion system translocon protein SseC [Salmonella enterica subsp. enterica serovar Enteritidis]ECF7023350.1 SPI-2 type III secretion system translocon protein SseC [Salmonella enterica subsp. enterica]ECY8076082.1 SPI-2 type III secretion system translocon protein Ss
MNRIHSNSDSAAGVTALTHHHLSNVSCVSSGSLGKRQHRVNSTFGDGNAACLLSGKISLQEASNALKQLLDAVPGNHKRPSLPDFLQTNPAVLSMMMTSLILNVFGNNAQSLCQQLERATEVQNALRNKQVKEYQEQIQKAIEQEDKARKAGIFGAIFDWITGILETVIGALKVVEGFLSGNPAEMASGVAYMAAGCAGMVKAGAETAMMCGADHDTCQAIIDVTSKIQFGCEAVALALDVFQIGRAFMATRGLSGAAAKVLDSGFGEEMVERMVGAGEAEIEALAEKFGEEVSESFSKQFEPLEREMVSPVEMEEESAEFSRNVEKNMTKNAGKSFTKEGVKAMAKEAVKEALEKYAQEGEKFLLKNFRNKVLFNMFKKILYALLRDCSFKGLQAIRCATEGANQMNTGMVNTEKAKLEKKIEQLITQQRFLDFIMQQTDDQKKIEQKRLEELYKGSGAALRDVLDTIDHYSSVQARIAGCRA